MYDVVVVGGGLIGAACADALARDGLRVCLVEAGPLVRESSWAGAGILHPIHPAQYPAPLQPLLRAAVEAHERCARTLSCDVELDRSGLLLLGDDGEALACWCGEDFAHRWVEARDEEPALRSGGRALLLPDAYQVKSHLLARALLGRARASGADLLDYQPVVGLRPGVVETRDGPLSARWTVVCAGAWASRLCPALEVEPVRGQILLYKGELRRIVIFDDGAYAVPRRGGRVLFGSTLERVGFAGGPTPDACDALAARAEARLGLRSDDQLAAWAGLRPATKSLLPYLGPDPQRPDLVYACGHYRNGILLAPLTGAIVADHVCERAPRFDLAPFTPPHA